MDKYDVILFLGQSNMQGQSGSLFENEEVEGALEYRFLTDELVPLKDPVGEDVSPEFKASFPYDEKRDDEWRRNTIIASPVDGCTTLVPEFCRSYIKVTGRKVVAVHAAKGATVAAEWLPGTIGYLGIQTKTSACFKKLGKNIGHVFCVWLQGESDAISSTSLKDYMERITIIKNQLKADFGLEKFGIIKVGKFTLDEKDEVIFSAQEKLCEQDEDFLMLTRITKRLLDGKKYENVYCHYNAEGQRIIGRVSGHNFGVFVSGGTRIEDKDVEL